MILHEAPDNYEELIQATAQHLQIPAVYVEKDYWVTRALKRLHESDYRDDIVFKGGTSLSKAHKLIQRFSEDIDLAVRPQDIGNARRKSLLRGAERAIAQDLDYQPGHPLESKHGRFRKTAHAFPMRTDASQLGQVADTIVLEINALSTPEPATLLPIATLISEFLGETDRDNLIDQFELESFDVLVLDVERTVCEKIMGLVRASYEADAVADFRRRIRHFYDITMILREPRYRDFIATAEFLAMIDDVKESDRLSMPNSTEWLEPPLADAMIFAETDLVWSAIKSDFHGNFKDMVYSEEMPSDNEVIGALNIIRARL